MTAKNHDQNLLGLTDEEVLRSRREHGVNLLTPPKRVSPWKLYFEKFKDPVIRILLFAAFLSLIISVIENQYAETIGIIVAILLATGIGFVFEYDAKRKFDLLNTVNDELSVKVMRNGSVHEIPRKDVVKGDIVMLETGDEVPADGTLLKTVSMQVNESMLTGEPIVNKTTYPERFDKEATYASNRAMRGTTIVEGYGTMRVIAVGDATEIGHVARQSMEQTDVETPLNIQLSRFAKLISKIGFGVAALVFVIFVSRDLYIFISKNEITGWHQYIEIARIFLKYFMMAVTLIVVAVPEGLPMSVTLSLALNMRRMLKTNNLVRNMHASETMGAINVICTDKTGTLTQNRMEVLSSFFDGKENKKLKEDDECSRLIIEGICTNTTAFLETGIEKVQGVGNPTEVALLLWLYKYDIDYLNIRESATIIGQITFSTERKFMAVLIDSSLFPGKRILYVKGAPEILMDKCAEVLNGVSTVEMVSYRPKINDWLVHAQGKAMRTLGFAYKIVDKNATDCSAVLAEGGLIFMGVMAIADPIRSDVADAVNECRSAGIDIKIVTGDTQITATEIARQIGLWGDSDTDINRITGPAFAELNDEEAFVRVEKLKVISRARPSDKQRLVQLLQQRGLVVAVTGDGTNDAPALNHAQVGLSMGSGTSVAKEASDITLLDDSFASIGTAVMWGRSLYKNIQRFIVFQLTINMVALCSELIGSFVGTTLPLTVTQMLWVNLIMDTFASLALSSIPPSKEVMKDKPRKLSDFIINRSMWTNILVTGSIFLCVLIGLIVYYTVKDGLMSNYHLTVFFTVFVMLQFWNLLNMRVTGTNNSALYGLSKSYGLLLVAGIIFIGQFLIVQFGGVVFRTVPLDWLTWVEIIAATSLTLWIGEIVRLCRKKIKK